jgi:nicotinamidase-related amidase
MNGVQPTLILLDCQQDQVRKGDIGVGETIACIRRLLVTGRNSGWRILHSQFKPARANFAPRSDSCAPIDGLRPLSSEVVFVRSALSAYADPAFDRAVAQAEEGPCFLVGFSAQFSLLATLFDAVARGQRLTVVPQAVGGSSVGQAAESTARDVTFDLISRLTSTVGWDDVLEAWTPQADPQIFRRMGTG